MNGKEISAALEWRYAVKKFDATKKISDSDWKVLQESLIQSPSSYGLQPWKFLVIENKEIREKLKTVSWNQTQVTDSSHYVVLAIKEKMDAAHIQRYIERIQTLRGGSLESLDGFKKMMTDSLVGRADITMWAEKQVYIAMGFVLETAALLNVDACPMEGIDPKAYDEILNLKDTGYKTVATVALGYRHAEDKLSSAKKVRFAAEDVVQYVK